ncbi:acetoacetate--CoA ligase [Amycolatopsis arida]|nr:acetoacetate--CoA ligase [Amycolatopsis arida]
MTADVPEVLWRPSPEQVEKSRMAEFRRWLATSRGVSVADYAGLWEWSVGSPGEFWGALAEFVGVRWHEPPREVVSGGLPAAEWFVGGSLNYAEHALSPVAGAAKGDGDVAVVFEREDGAAESLTFGELRARVAAARAVLRGLGVGRGDRVVALAPNCPQTLVAFLAAASVGAVWSSCSPDFGVRAVADRFAQIEPRVLVAVDGYHYNGRTFDVRPTVEQLRSELPSLAATVLVNYAGLGGVDGTLDWDGLLAQHQGAELGFDAVPAEHPLWVLYSSGTTGLPKGIVHGHAGITVEHLKALALHADLGRGERLFWFTTTGWMMWNYLISGLLVGATVVLYDGSPGHPNLDRLWDLAARHKVTYFGTSAPFIQACLKADLNPAAGRDLSALRAVGSTGAPLSPEGFRWLAAQLPGVQVCSVSGGTDLCTAFVGSAPDVPVWAGELSCRWLGAAVQAFDDRGDPVIGEVGELVITQPMPSMPVGFWNDPDHTRYHDAYYAEFPGVWRHGDWITITDRGSAIIHGRSDSTLNRGGVRMGTAEFYRLVETHPEVVDSLVIDTTTVGQEEGQLLCFLVLADDASLEELEPTLRRELRTALSPRHVPDHFIPVPAIPRTLNGKKCEVPVKKILTGTAPDRAVSRDALANPDALDPFVALGRQT